MAGLMRARSPVRFPISTSSIAPLIAPQAVCPKRTMAFAPDTAHANSKLPIRSSLTTLPAMREREGRFNQFAAEVSYDPGRPAGTRVDLTVYTNSVDMHNREHDRLLMSDDFFDVEHFPTMRFTGSLANAGDDGALKVVGDLTIRGVTKQISAPVAVQPAGAQSAAMFEASFRIDRTEFGLNGTSSRHG